MRSLFCWLQPDRPLICVVEHAYDLEMKGMTRLTAHIRQRTNSSAGSARAARDLEVTAATYEAAEQAVRDQLPTNWIVASLRVDRTAQDAS